MANRAILLIEAALGKSRDVVSMLRSMSWVTSADRVTPPYDVIAFVEMEAPIETAEEIKRSLTSEAGIAGLVICAVDDPDRQNLTRKLRS